MKRFFSVLMAVITIFSAMTIGFTDCAFAADEAYCKIKKTDALVLINPLMKLELYADWYADEDCELVWSVEGKSRFVNGETEKNAKGENAELLFIDDSTVILKLVAPDGRVLAENEMFLKSYAHNGADFFENIKTDIAFILAILYGFIGSFFYAVTGRI